MWGRGDPERPRVVARRLNENNVLLTIYHHTLCSLPSSLTAVNRRINENHRVEAINLLMYGLYIFTALLSSNSNSLSVFKAYTFRANIIRKSIKSPCIGTAFQYSRYLRILTLYHHNACEGGLLGVWIDMLVLPYFKILFSLWNHFCAE